jgi:23S rRNA-/tRNA-specific pseudouridylate synthase
MVSTQATKEPEILREDSRVLWINKPAGWVTIRSRDPEAPVIWDWAKSKWGEEIRVVHRLDRGTSGVLILAKNRDAQKELTQLWSQGKVKKKYLAWVRGKFPLPRLSVRTPIGLKHAWTQIIRKKIEDELSLLEVEILTGRTHQIRIHLAEQGFPVLGDRKYGEAPFPSRMALHAEWLEIAGFGSVQAPIPKDFWSES